MFENVVPDDYDKYVIEIGNQICIMADGTTENKDSEMHLKKFTDVEVKNLYSKSLRIIDIMDRKLPNEESDKERISLLSTPIGELAKMLAISRVSKCNPGHSPWEKLGGLRWI